MIEQLSKKNWGYIVVYYDTDYPDYKELKELYSSFDKTEWNIDQCPMITTSDKNILRRYIEELIRIFDKTIDMCINYNMEQISKILTKEKKKIMATLDDEK